MSDPLVSWSQAYQSLVNEPYIRSQLVNLNQPLGFYTFGEQKWEIHGDKGTLYYEIDDEGHFMSYSVLDEEVLVYDPSWPDGNYAPRTEADRQLFYRDLDEAFAGYPWTIYIPDGRAVQAEFDTWCQTWSLAWLDPELQGSVYQAQRHPQSVEEILKEIVFEFVDRLRHVRLGSEDLESYQEVMSGRANASANWHNFWRDEDVAPAIARRLNF